MKIKRIASLLLTAALVNGCSLLEKEDKFVYVPEPEQAELDRPAVDRAKTLTDLGLAYYRLGKYDYALENLEKSLAIDSENAVTYQLIALINERSKQPVQAQAYFDKALSIAPENNDIITSYAIFLYQQARFDEALIEFKRVSESPFYQKKWVAYTYLGYYDLKNKQMLQAEKRFFYALQGNPEYAPALIEMARIKYAEGKMMSARAFIERYFSQAGKTLEGLQLAIKIERTLQSNEMAEAYQLELNRKYPFAK